MNEQEIEQILKKMHTLQPKPEAFGALRGRVFGVIDAGARPVTPPFWSRYSVGAYASAIMFILILVAANQMPMHSTYNRSISSLASLEQAGYALENGTSPATNARNLQAILRSTRATLDELKLKGQFGAYSQSDCLHAYVLYDSYLDYLSGYLDEMIPMLKDPDSAAAFKELQAYVADSQTEANARITMYSPSQQ